MPSPGTGPVADAVQGESSRGIGCSSNTHNSTLRSGGSYRLRYRIQQSNIKRHVCVCEAWLAVAAPDTTELTKQAQMEQTMNCQAYIIHTIAVSVP